MNSAQTTKPKLKVHLSLSGPLVEIRPHGYFGETLFASFRRAIEGSRFNPAKKTNVAALDKIPIILKRLREADFDAVMTADLREALQRYTVQQWNDDQSLIERTQQIDDDIFRRLGQRLFPYQRVGARWLAGRHAALLADDMGVGKTRQAIVALPAEAPTLIVVPASLKGEWVGEFEKCRPQIRPAVLKGRNSFRWPKAREVLITNYDILPEIHDPLGRFGRKCEGFLEPEPCHGCKDELVFTPSGVQAVSKGHLDGCHGFKPPKRCYGCNPLLKAPLPGTVLIYDEAQKIKGVSARALRARAISKAVRQQLNGRSWVLTGTPMENEPKELWYISEAAGIAEECFGNFKTFFGIFKGRVLDKGQFEWGLPDAEIVERMRRGSLRRMRADVLSELPPKLWQEVVVDIDKNTLKKCEVFLKDVGGTERLAELIEAEKVPFEMISSVRAALATAKIPALMGIVEEFHKKNEVVIVYSMHRAPIDAVGKLRGWATITGDTPVEKRRDIVQRFQDGKLRGLGLTIQAGGTGLTLTRARFGIFVDLSFKPTENAQAEDRQHRIGQDRGVVYTILKADHILDRRITEILLRKRELIVASVDASSVADNQKPLDEFAERIHEMQREIAQGRAVRHAAETEEQKRAVEEIGKLTFEKKGDERLALELVEQAVHIGLSTAQWKLFLEVVSRGSSRVQPVSDKETTKTDEVLAPSTEAVVDIQTTDEDLMAKVAGVVERVRAMTPEAREAFFEAIGLLEELDAVTDQNAFLEGFSRMKEIPLAKSLEALEKNFCAQCGSPDHKAKDCGDDLDEDEEDDSDDANDEDDEDDDVDDLDDEDDEEEPDE